MRKSELVYLIMAEGLAESQLEASKKLGISISTVNHALGPLKRMGAVRTSRRGFELLDKRKLLLFWASTHELRVSYATSVDSVAEAERLVPQGVLPTSFAAFKRLYGNAPSDYSETYLYASERSLGELKKRFPPSERKPNFFVLQAPEQLFAFAGKGCVPPSVVFVDLWNNKEWYAAEFAKVLERELLG